MSPKSTESTLENIFQQESVLRNQLIHEFIKDVEKLKKKFNSRDQLILSLQQELATVREENQQINAKLLNLNVAYESRLTEVAFTAGITSNAAFRRDETVIFPHVITNKGNAYNPNDGIFTAPENGTYSFYCSITSFETNNSWVKITKMVFLKLSSVHMEVQMIMIHRLLT
ncbi:uncharacterized protein LOC134250865 [Saccostrea cucullata]|uniref:uncharacterized protein LOC134250865 n=1 Tax=Saccostrea cuccullata TaxID=36930 RepID=UPI002ED5C61B